MGTRLARMLPALGAVLVMIPGSSSGETLGRLFFTPEQRATLESLRLAPTTAATATTSDRITVNGIVQRSRGPTTVWINGVPQNVPSKSIVPVGKARTPAVQVPVPGEDGQVRLKVGQSIEIGEPSADATDKEGGGSSAQAETPAKPSVDAGSERQQRPAQTPD